MFKQFSRRSAMSLEQEADRIADPLERLRYLRKNAPASVGAPWVAPTGISSRSSVAKKYVLLAAVVSLSGVASLLAVHSRASARPETESAHVESVGIPSAGPSADRVWLIESSENAESYSNGLRIDLTFATKFRPRAEYPVFASSGDSTPIAMAHDPRGIVFHTTESDMAPFEESANKKIEWLGHQLLQFVRREHSYHYVIDRYGRVYRVVEDSDAANHSGYSVWGDNRGVYVNLNESFLGVAFEGQTGKRSDVTAAQISAARMLTELLRSRYAIPSEDCVTHAQVSVAPWNMRIANHLDWARGFPWASLGLPDNYNLPVPSVAVFGFTHDDFLTQATGGRDWTGLQAADKKVSVDAAAQATTETRYRAMLHHRYQEIVTELRRQQQASKGPSSKESPSNEIDPIGPNGTRDIGEI